MNSSDLGPSGTALSIGIVISARSDPRLLRATLKSVALLTVPPTLVLVLLPRGREHLLDQADIAGSRLPISVLRADGLDDSWLTVGFRHLAPIVDIAMFTREGMLLDPDYTRAIERRYADWGDLVGILQVASELVVIKDSGDPSSPAGEHEVRAGAVTRMLRRRLRAPSLMSCALALRVAACGGLKFVTFSAYCDWLSYALTLDRLRARGRTALVWAEDLRELHLGAERRTGFDFGYTIYDRLSRINDYVDRGASPQPSYLNPRMEKIRLFAEQGLQLVLDPPSRGHIATVLQGMMAARRDSKVRMRKLQREIRELG
jgi:hypothetical protein